MARSLMTEPNEGWLGFLWRQLAREKNLLFYFWRLDDTTVIFPFRFTLCFICFSQPWQFLIVYHIGRKKGGIHLMISNPWDFQNKAKPFLFNLWFVSQNFCLLVFSRLGCSETVLDISHAYITDWCPCFWPNLRFGLSCNSSQLYMNAYSF